MPLTYTYCPPGKALYQLVTRSSSSRQHCSGHDGDGETDEQVDTRGPWSYRVRERISHVKLWLKNSQSQNLSKTVNATTSTPKKMLCMPNMKLLKTDLRKFSGIKLDMPQFWYIIRVAVHHNPEILPVQK